MDKKENTARVTARFLQAMDAIIANNINDAMNKTAFAARVGEHQQNFSMMAKGTRYPTIESCVLLCKVFGVNPAWLLTGAGQMFIQTRQDDLMKRIDDIEKRLDRLEKKK